MRGSIKRKYWGLRLAAFCMALLLGSSVYGQGKWFRRGETAYEHGLYSQAVELFQFSAKSDPTWKSQEGLARSLMEMKEYAKALKAYQSALQNDDCPGWLYRDYGKCLMNLGQYPDAVEAFSTYARKSPDDPCAARYQHLENALAELLADSSTHEVTKLPFNSPQSDFGAYPLGSGLVFASSRQDGFGIRTISTVDRAPLVDLYFVPFLEEKWGKPSPLGGDINTIYNDGPAVVLPGDTVMLFSRNYPNKSLKDEKDFQLNKLMLLEAHLTDGKWIMADKFKWNEKKIANCHPTLSADGQTLIFTSDRPGGYGKTDLWKCEWENGEWGKPQNLGPEINTEGNEMFPSLAKDGTLYFASDEYLGLGGLDLFVSRPFGNGWTRPINMGYPINSAGDDFAFYLGPDGKTGYLTSNRGNDGRDDNLFQVKVLIPDFDCVPQEENYYCYRFFEPDTVDIYSLPVIYEWDFGDGNTAYGPEHIHCFDLPGTYQVALNLIDTVTGIIFMNQSRREVSPADMDQVFIEGPDTVILGQAQFFNGAKSIIPDFPFAEIQAYYWNVDGMWLQGVEQVLSFDRLGEHVLTLGVVARVPGQTEEVKACVTRPIWVMEEKAYQRAQDSLAQARRDADILEKPSKAKVLVDSIRKAGPLEVIDPDGPKPNDGSTYRVQIGQSDTLISENSFELKDVKNWDVIQQGDKYNYMVGEEDNPKDLYPLYLELRSQGFLEALVVAIKHDSIITGNDSTFYLRHPESDRLFKVTLLEGVVTDADSNPLVAEITLENLLEGIVIKKMSSDPTNGTFEIRLPGGKLYGYVAEAEGFMPYSNYLDLRQAQKEDSIVKEEIRLLTMRQVIEQGIPIRLNNIFFDFDSDNLRPESKSELNRLRQIIFDNPNLRVEIMGHTDWVGTGEYNLHLSDRRADAVRKYLVNAGVSAQYLISRGYGETRPMAPNNTPEGRQLNRRVEFRFLPKTNP